MDYETLIKRELILYGPVGAIIDVYDEFQNYASGMFKVVMLHSFFWKEKTVKRDSKKGLDSFFQKRIFERGKKRFSF